MSASISSSSRLFVGLKRSDWAANFMRFKAPVLVGELLQPGTLVAQLGHRALVISRSCSALRWDRVAAHHHEHIAVARADQVHAIGACPTGKRQGLRDSQTTDDDAAVGQALPGQAMTSASSCWRCNCRLALPASQMNLPWCSRRAANRCRCRRAPGFDAVGAFVGEQIGVVGCAAPKTAVTRASAVSVRAHVSGVVIVGRLNPGSWAGHTGQSAASRSRKAAASTGQFTVTTPAPRGSRRECRAAARADRTGWLAQPAARQVQHGKTD